jgi:putative flippase GtrA
MKLKQLIRIILKKLWKKEEWRFLVIGGGVTLAQVILLTLIVEVGGGEKAIGNRWLQIVAFFASFFLHRNVTWADRKNAFWRDFLLFFLTRGMLTLLNTACFEYLIRIPQIPYMLITPALLMGEAGINFLIGRFLIYRKKKTA